MVHEANTAAHLNWRPVTIPDSVPPPTATHKSRPGERWLNASVVIGAILVYLSVYLQSAITFVVGQAFCAGAGVIIAWRHRAEIRHWWRQRFVCPNCGAVIPMGTITCPHCGHKRIP